MIVSARLELLAAPGISDLALGDEIRGLDVPPSDSHRTQEVAPAFLDVKKARARRTQHPFLGARAQKINSIQRDWKRAEGLDGIDRK